MTLSHSLHATQHVPISTCYIHLYAISLHALLIFTLNIFVSPSTNPHHHPNLVYLYRVLNLCNSQLSLISFLSLPMAPTLSPPHFQNYFFLPYHPLSYHHPPSPLASCHSTYALSTYAPFTSAQKAPSQSNAQKLFFTHIRSFATKAALKPCSDTKAVHVLNLRTLRSCSLASPQLKRVAARRHPPFVLQGTTCTEHAHQILCTQK